MTCHTTHPTADTMTPATTTTTTAHHNRLPIDSSPNGEDPRVERTRAAVISAATDLMMTEGPGAITHANVAAAAEVSRTTVYTHWPTREDLLRSTIDSIRDCKPRVEDLTGSVRADLGTLMRPLVADLVDDQRAPMIATMMQRALHDSEVVSVRDEFIDEFVEMFGTIIDTAIASGDLRGDVDPRRGLASIVGSFLFLRFMTSDAFDTTTADAILDDFVRLNAAS